MSYGYGDPCREFVPLKERTVSTGGDGRCANPIGCTQCGTCLEHCLDTFGCTRREMCPTCDGAGTTLARPFMSGPSKAVICPTCRGTRTVPEQ